MRVLLLMIALTFSAIGYAAEPQLHADVVTAIQSAIERGDAHAVVVGLYDNGQTSIISFGSLGRDDKRKPQGDTIFEIGSISKVFTSLKQCLS